MATQDETADSTEQLTPQQAATSNISPQDYKMKNLTRIVKREIKDDDWPDDEIEKLKFEMKLFACWNRIIILLNQLYDIHIINEDYQKWIDYFKINMNKRNYKKIGLTNAILSPYLFKSDKKKIDIGVDRIAALKDALDVYDLWIKQMKRPIQIAYNNNNNNTNMYGSPNNMYRSPNNNNNNNSNTNNNNNNNYNTNNNNNSNTNNNNLSLFPPNTSLFPPNTSLFQQNNMNQSQILQIPPIPSLLQYAQSSSLIPRKQEQKPNFSDYISEYNYMCNQNKNGSFWLPSTTPLELMRILDLAIKQGMNLLLINYKIAHIRITNKSLIHRKNKYDHDRL